MPSQPRLVIAKNDIFEALSTAAKRPLSRSDLARLLAEHRDLWRLAQRTTVDDFIEFLKEKGRLREYTLTSVNYSKNLARFSWGPSNTLQLALSVCKQGYLTHASAVWVHGLTDLIPQITYVNCEQSPKPRPAGNLSQASIDNAFKRTQRTTNLIYECDEQRIAIIAGKNTERLGVQSLKAMDGTIVEATNLERTLIDITVRPTYAGGIAQVLEAFRSARDRVSTNRLVAILKQLDYVYPYHQSIGYLMQLAGYPEQKYSRLREMGLNFDFHLTYALKESTFVSEWRLHVPRGLE